MFHETDQSAIMQEAIDPFDRTFREHRAMIVDRLRPAEHARVHR